MIQVAWYRLHVTDCMISLRYYILQVIELIDCVYRLSMWAKSSKTMVHYLLKTWILFVKTSKSVSDHLFGICAIQLLAVHCEEHGEIDGSRGFAHHLVEVGVGWVLTWNVRGVGNVMLHNSAIQNYVHNSARMQLNYQKPTV